MQLKRILTAASVAAVIAATPAVALAGSPGKSGNAPGHHKPTSSQSATTTTPPTKAYGKYCLAAGTSKKHVAGTPGTPFSVCVTDAAKAAHDAKMSARAACEGDSRKHVAGTPGTPFSECVSAIGKMRAAQHKSQHS